MSFILGAAALLLLIFAVLARHLFSLAANQSTESNKALAILKAQMHELEQDIQKGLLLEAEAKAARAELGRKIIAEAKRGEAHSNPIGKSAQWGALLLSLAILAGGGLGAYSYLGAPGYKDQPLAMRLDAVQKARQDRLAQDEAEAKFGTPPSEKDMSSEHLELVNTLEKKLEGSNDPTGWQLLATNRARLGQFKEAYLAQENLIKLLGEKAKAQEYNDLAEYKILAAGGYVTSSAEADLQSALARDPSLPQARYYSGLALAQLGRFDLAYEIWLRLLEDGPEDAPWVQTILPQFANLAAAAGKPVPDMLRGPTAEDMQSAQSMDSEDRNAMIETMVAQLGERLANEGGSPAEWARLVKSLGVLGRDEEAKSILKEAQEKFKDDPNALAILEDGAR